MISRGEYQIRQILDHFPNMAYWKDIINDCFIGCNSKFSKFLELEHSEQIIGKCGYDYFDSSLVEKFRSYETQAITKKSKINVHDEIYHSKTGLTTIDITVAPIFDEHNVITSIICYGTSKIILSEKPWHDAIKLICKDYMHNIVRSNRYELDLDGNQINLSKREAECALYLIKGLKSKEISKEMSITPKTVDNYIENIKDKLGCKNRSEISKLLFDYNFVKQF